MSIPFAVRIKTNRTDRHITRQVRDLSFREVAIGGWANATFSLDHPLSFQPDEIAPFGRVYIYHDGQIVWNGRLEDPGSGADASGEVWHLTAMGPSAHARDTVTPRYYVDTRAERFFVGITSTKHCEVSSRGEDDPAITMRVAQGSNWLVNEAGLVVWSGANDAGQTLARISVAWDGGFTSSNNEVRLATSTLPAASVTRDSAALSTAGGTLVCALGGALPTGEDAVYLRTIRLTSNFIPVNDDTFWAEFTNFVVRTRLKNASGANINSGYSGNTIRADQVINDLLGDVLTEYDGPNALVDTTTHAIDHLVYPDGVTPADIFDDMMTFEPAFRWGAYEYGATDLARFEWTTWPSTVRYECTAQDGIDLPSSAAQLYNRVRVRYVTANGTRKTIQRTAAVPELDDEGVVREADLDLGDNAGTLSNAQRAGDEFLAQHASPPAAGTLTIARPIYDLAYGRMVQPWEIKAGELIRIRDVMPRSAALTATGRDGISVFRIASKEYNTDTASARLDLDTQSLSTAKALAELAKLKTSRRRR
ncbi:MAG TPA: hypothetical protein VFR23_11620 [Jiangellaceae bacterium]|nr:hypothetical protein [Jiangellaceae bacterium]